MFNKIVNVIGTKIFMFLRVTLGNIEWVWPKYRVPRLQNINTWDNVEYKNPLLKIGSSSSYELLEFVLEISEKLSKSIPFSLVRMGDGEMFYLQGKIIGNLVSRHKVSVNIDKKELDIVKEKMIVNDYLLFFHNPSMLKLMPNDCNFLLKQSKYDLYIIYQLIATKLLFRILSDKKIGLIGADKKLDLIKELVVFQEYKEEIGIKDFYEYIKVPQIGAGTNYKKTLETIEKQMHLDSDVYLVGIGVSKLYILPKLKEKYKKTFIDIGSGIDALAGIIPNTRSYFGNWVNYRKRNYDYSEIDILSYQNDSIKKIENIEYLD